MLHCSYVRTRRLSYQRVQSQNSEGTIQPLVETCRQSSQGAAVRTNRCVGHINEIARVLTSRRIYKNIGKHMYITTVDDELNVD